MNGNGYLGDNARAPYGTRSFDLVYEYTLQAVKDLFSQGAPIIVLACNTASAKALRSIQQNYLPRCLRPGRRVLGVIRPTVEALPGVSRSGHIGILATPGTIASHSYRMEIAKIAPQLQYSNKCAYLFAIHNFISFKKHYCFYHKLNTQQIANPQYQHYFSAHQDSRDKV